MTMNSVMELISNRCTRLAALRAQACYEHDHNGGHASEDIGRSGGGLAREDKITGHVTMGDQLDEG